MSNYHLLPTIWMPIKNYPNYAISICGQVKNIKTQRILKQFNNGYYSVGLVKNKESTILSVHRLLALTYIPNINNLMFVDHINNCRTDNRISNLRWCTTNDNQHNRLLNKNSKTKIKGVYFHKRAKKWCSIIRFNNVLIYLGLFNDINDAVQARKTKAQELYGEFLNDCEK